MKLPVKVYKSGEDNFLHFISAGECEVYAPKQVQAAGQEIIIEPYVSLNFGQVRLHIDIKDFTKLCEQFLYNKVEDKNEALLRPRI